MKWMQKRAVEGPAVQTLDRGLRVLHLLASEPDGLSVSELAARLEVHRAIVYRLLGTLAEHRLVIRGDDGRHRLWTGLVELARGVIPRWQSLAVPELTSLAEDLRATATLAVASEDAAVALLVIEPMNTSIHVAYRPGTRHPLTAGAFGKAILAGRAPVDGEPTEVTAARRRGWATSRGEIQPGSTALAAPIVIDDWADASVGVVSFTDFDEAFGRRVRAAAERIAAGFPARAVPTPRGATGR